MDILLNGEIDGIEAAKQIRELYNIPFIYVTGSYDNSIFEKAKITEPSGFIKKPFDDTEIKTAIKTAITQQNDNHCRGVIIRNDETIQKVHLDIKDDESPEVSLEVQKLYENHQYIDVLKVQAHMLRKRRGNCSNWLACNDLDVVARIVQKGEINLKVPELFNPSVNTNMNSIWKLVEKVIYAIENL